MKKLKRIYGSMTSRGEVKFSIGTFVVWSIHDAEFNRLFLEHQAGGTGKSNFKNSPSIDRIVPGLYGGQYEMGNIRWVTVGENAKKTAIRAEDKRVVKGKPVYLIHKPSFAYNLFATHRAMREFLGISTAEINKIKIGVSDITEFSIVDDVNKKCRGCGETKLLEEFKKPRSIGLNSRCKSCLQSEKMSKKV